MATAHFEAMLDRRSLQATLVAFDLMWVGSDDLRPLPLAERRKWLDLLCLKAYRRRRANRVPTRRKARPRRDRFQAADKPYPSGPAKHWLKMVMSLNGVEDCYGSYTSAPSDGSARSGDCESRVTRGGAFTYDGTSIRSASRHWDSSQMRSRVTGFRVARDLDNVHP